MEPVNINPFYTNFKIPSFFLFLIYINLYADNIKACTCISIGISDTMIWYTKSRNFIIIITLLYGILIIFNHIDVRYVCVTLRGFFQKWKNVNQLITY